MKRKKLKIILAIVVFLALSGGLYAYREFTRKVKDLTYVKAGVQLDAAGLITAFEKDEAQGNEKYLDKIIAVKGKVKTVEKNGNGYYTVILGEDNSMSSVRCSMDSVHQQDVASLSAGTIITMKGACSGFNKDELLGSDVILNRCVVEN
jgi:hypothetical protein